MEAGGDSSSTVVADSVEHGDARERIKADGDGESVNAKTQDGGDSQSEADAEIEEAEDAVLAEREGVTSDEAAVDEDESDARACEDAEDAEMSAEEDTPLQTASPPEDDTAASRQTESVCEATPVGGSGAEQHAPIETAQESAPRTQAGLSEHAQRSRSEPESVDSRTTESQALPPVNCSDETQAKSADVRRAVENAEDGDTPPQNGTSSACDPPMLACPNSPEAVLSAISNRASEATPKTQPPTAGALSRGARDSAPGRPAGQTDRPRVAAKPDDPTTGCQTETGLVSRTDLVTSTRGNDQEDNFLSELDAELDELLGAQDLNEADLLNGLMKKETSSEEFSQLKLMRAQSQELQRQVDDLNRERKSLQDRQAGQEQLVAKLGQEKDSLQLQLKKAESIQAVHLHRIKEHESFIDQQKVELAASKERQTSHDAAAKKAITTLQQEMILRVDQVKSMYEEAIKEKESIVIKYAKSEKEVLDQKKLREASEKSKRDLAQSLESLKGQLGEVKKDRVKLRQSAASKETEASYMTKEVEQLKEEVSSQAIKVKWAQNKLKTELDAHKETKVRLAKTEQRLTEAKEETEQIRKNCQEMIKTYQTSEEVKSNNLDKLLKVKHSELEQKLLEHKEHQEVHQARLRELDSLKKNLHDNIAELDSLKVKNKCLEEERLQNDELLAKFKELLNSQKEENRRLNRQMEEKKALTQELEDLKQTEIQLRSEVSGQKVDQSDLETELETSRKKETELLQFTERITSKNTSLSSDNATLLSKTSHLVSQLQSLQREQTDLKTSYNQLSMELKQERQYREQESTLLTCKLSEKSRALEQLSIQLDEARDDNKTLKRKHVANTKDLTRQLQQAHKRLESLESGDNPSRDNLSVGSRTSSSGSLDTLPGSNPSAANSSSSSASVGAPTSSSSAASNSTSSRQEEPPAPHDHTVAIATGNDYPGVDKGMLVDRIVRLQKAHQRKNEKIEFMQEHMTHLVDELKKKSKIIQQYIMRDEAGALVPVSSDINKPPSGLRNTMAQMSKQVGIMSSLYRSQQTDPTMTLELSLEINRKLQAVLEDTLLKNITLKENIETLGQEIARLLKEQQNKKMNHPSLR